VAGVSKLAQDALCHRLRRHGRNSTITTAPTLCFVVSFKNFSPCGSRGLGVFGVHRFGYIRRPRGQLFWCWILGRRRKPAPPSLWAPLLLLLLLWWWGTPLLTKWTTTTHSTTTHGIPSRILNAGPPPSRRAPSPSPSPHVPHVAC
jgi:hypothetical protein